MVFVFRFVFVMFSLWKWNERKKNAPNECENERWNAFGVYLCRAFEYAYINKILFPFDLTYMDILTIRLKPVCLFFELESSLYFIWLCAQHIHSFVRSFVRTLNKMIVLNFVCSFLESTLMFGFRSFLFFWLFIIIIHHVPHNFHLLPVSVYSGSSKTHNAEKKKKSLPFFLYNEKQIKVQSEFISMNVYIFSAHFFMLA